MPACIIYTSTAKRNGIDPFICFLKQDKAILKIVV
jgi:hypothetical protein